MEFNVDINPQDVNEAIVKAVLESSIGELVKNSVEKQVIFLLKNSSPIDKIINEIIAEVIRNAVLVHKERIRAAITEKLTDEYVDKAITKFGEWLGSKYHF